jgi:uncharacterized Zn finger protein
MDTGKGYFDEIGENKAKEIQAQLAKHLDKPIGPSVFHVGETLIVKNSKFRVKSIKLKPGELRLRLLPTENEK